MQMCYGGEKRKTIIFNLDRQDEREMFELVAKAPNFSKWVKGKLSEELRLMKAKQSQQAQQPTHAQQAQQR